MPILARTRREAAEESGKSGATLTGNHRTNVATGLRNGPAGTLWVDDRCTPGQPEEYRP